MKILNIMLSRQLGGTQQAFLDYNTALKLQNVQVINIISYKAKIHFLLNSASFTLPNLAPIDIFSILILKYIIYKTNPDIIIAHGNRAINFSKIAKPTQVKLVGVAHNYSLNGLKKCDYVIVLTNHMKTYLQANNFPISKIFFLPNMIDIKKSFILDKFFHTPVVIGMLARFVPKKGAEIFIRAIHILKDKGYKFKAIIGGDGEEKKNLLTLTNKLDLNSNIDFVGWVNDKDKFFSQLDIFCLPSLHEPFGIILLEAMESSLPVVSTNTEGPNEIITHMQDGLIAVKGSAQSLAEKLTYLIDRPETAVKLSKTAYTKLKENYDIKIIAKKLAKFCKHKAIMN